MILCRVSAQVLGNLIVAKSAPVGTPRLGHPSFRFLAPPLPNRPASLGSVGAPELDEQKSGAAASAAAPCSCLVTLRLFATGDFPPSRAQNRSASQSFGFSPSLRSIRPAHDGSALLTYFFRLKKASLPRYWATSSSSSQSPLQSERPGLGIPPSAPLLLLSPTDPLRWARSGPRSWTSKKAGPLHPQRPLVLVLSRFACSRRATSLRLGLKTGLLRSPSVFRPRSGPSALLTTAQRFSLTSSG